MNDILMQLVIGSFLGYFLLTPAMYFVVTKKYDQLYTNYHTLTHIRIPIVSTIARGNLYGFCVLFNPKKRSTKEVQELTDQVNFNNSATNLEKLISVLNFSLGLIFMISGIILYFQ